MKIVTKRRIFLREATLALLIARFAVRSVSSETLFAWIGRPLRRGNRFAVTEIDWVEWAITTREATSGTARPDLAPALAAHLMLRRRRIESRVCLGLIRENDTLKSFSWVKAGEKIILQPAEFAKITLMAEFGGRH